MMKTLIITIFLSVIATFSAQAEALPNTKETLIATLLANNETLKFGNSMELTLRLANSGPEDIIMHFPPKFHTNTHLNGIMDGSSIRVTDKTGKLIEHVKLPNPATIIEGQAAILDAFERIPKNSTKEIKIKILIP